MSIHRGDRRNTRRGQAVIEFALALPFLLIMVIGGFVVGMMFDRHLTVLQLVRNAGSMYARGIDFGNDTNKSVLLRSASGLAITPNGGDGVVYLSVVMMVPPGGGDNENQPVITQRIAIGSSNLKPSPLGVPPVDPSGAVPDFLNDPAAVATLSADVSGKMRPNDRLFIAEAYHEPIDLNYSPIQFVDLLYSRAHF